MTITVVALLIAFQLKHFLADYVLQQNRYMLGKFKPGWDFVGPLFLHVLVHAAFTFGIAAVTIASANEYLYSYLITFWALKIALFDGAVHFIIDRLKASPRWMGRWKSLTAEEYVHNQGLLEGPEYDSRIEEGAPADVKFWLQQVPKNRAKARARLRGNSLFWCSLGLDQMVHHLTHYVCIYLILRCAGALL